MRVPVQLLLFVFMGGCDCSLRDEAFDLAGNGAKDCGLVPIGHSAAVALDCALDAMEAKGAFVVRLELRGKDSHVVEAWVGQRDGDVFHLLYDGDPGGGGGDDHPRIQRFACIEPSRRTLSEDDPQQTNFAFDIDFGDDVFACAQTTPLVTICD